MEAILYKEESYKIIGCCIEVYNELGKGFLEVIYKDALEHEFGLKNIPYSRERAFDVIYKGNLLQRKYCADFVLYDKIILKVKHMSSISDGNIKQTLNYLKVTNFKLGLLANFGENSFNSKRIVF
ncbi:MAG: GxxExxY protein [Ignavibacteria bacterium]|nr:GxxExxY protein [Ignavibacteria bacterium]